MFVMLRWLTWPASAAYLFWNRPSTSSVGSCGLAGVDSSNWDVYANTDWRNSKTFYGSPRLYAQRRIGSGRGRLTKPMNPPPVLAAEALEIVPLVSEAGWQATQNATFNPVPGKAVPYET